MSSPCSLISSSVPSLQTKCIFLLNECIPKPINTNISGLLEIRNNPPPVQGLNMEFNETTCDSYRLDVPRATNDRLDTFDDNIRLRYMTSLPGIDASDPPSTFFMNNFQVLVEVGADTNIKYVVAFCGRRWIVFRFAKGWRADSVDLPPAFRNVSNSYDKLQLFRDSGFEPQFFSSPVDYSTTTYQQNPLGLKWYVRKQNLDEPLFQWEVDETQEADVRLACVGEETFCATKGTKGIGLCWGSVIYHSDTTMWTLIRRQ